MLITYLGHMLRTCKARIGDHSISLQSVMLEHEVTAVQVAKREILKQQCVRKGVET